LFFFFVSNSRPRLFCPRRFWEPAYSKNSNPRKTGGPGPRRPPKIQNFYHCRVLDAGPSPPGAFERSLPNHHLARRPGWRRPSGCRQMPRLGVGRRNSPASEPTRSMPNLVPSFVSPPPQHERRRCRPPAPVPTADGGGPRPRLKKAAPAPRKAEPMDFHSRGPSRTPRRPEPSRPAVSRRNPTPEKFSPVLEPNVRRPDPNFEIRSH